MPASGKISSKKSLKDDQKILSLFAKHFADTSSQIKSSFDQMFSPVLKKTEDDMKRFQTQGENTLHSWEQMMNQYASGQSLFLLCFSSLSLQERWSLLFPLIIWSGKRELQDRCVNLTSNGVEEYFKRKNAEDEAQSKK